MNSTTLIRWASLVLLTLLAIWSVYHLVLLVPLISDDLWLVLMVWGLFAVVALSIRRH